MFERSFELFIALEFCRGTASRHGRERGSKGKERKERKKERNWEGVGSVEEDAKEKRDSFIKDSVSFQLFFPIAPDSIFLGRNDLRHGPLLLSVREKAWKTRVGGKVKKRGERVGLKFL